MLTRSQLLQNIEKLLKSQGYKTSDIYDQGSFDIVARKNLLILLLKTFQNIAKLNESTIEITFAETIVLKNFPDSSILGADQINAALGSFDDAAAD